TCVVKKQQSVAIAFRRGLRLYSGKGERLLTQETSLERYGRSLAPLRARTCTEQTRKRREILLTTKCAVQTTDDPFHRATFGLAFGSIVFQRKFRTLPTRDGSWRRQSQTRGIS